MFLRQINRKITSDYSIFRNKYTNARINQLTEEKIGESYEVKVMFLFELL